MSITSSVRPRQTTKTDVVKNVVIRMVDNQSTTAHRPTFCWGCFDRIIMIDVKLQSLSLLGYGVWGTGGGSWPFAWVDGTQAGSDVH